MNLHPWDFWQKDGSPKPWTPELISVLENTIKKYPDHPGANHYYIHVMEASPYASKANPSADKLGGLAPGLSHMVHMPSHIYIRTGEYGKGRLVNEAAVKMYYQYKKIYPAVVSSAFLYEYHNLHMLAASSLNEDDYSQAIRDALACRKALDTSLLSADAPMGNYLQYIYMTPAFTMIRFEKWQDILQEPNIAYQYHYGRLILEFARGMAYAHTGHLDKSKSSLAIMDSLLKEKDMSVVLEPFNAPVSGGFVAKYILMGAIAEMENKTTEAIQYFEKGVANRRCAGLPGAPRLACTGETLPGESAAERKEIQRSRAGISERPQLSAEQLYFHDRIQESKGKIKRLLTHLFTVVIVTLFVQKHEKSAL